MLLDCLVEGWLHFQIATLVSNCKIGISSKITWYMRTVYCSQTSCVFVSLGQTEVGESGEDAKKYTFQLVIDEQQVGYSLSGNHFTGLYIVGLYREYNSMQVLEDHIMPLLITMGEYSINMHSQLWLSGSIWTMMIEHVYEELRRRIQRHIPALRIRTEKVAIAGVDFKQLLMQERVYTLLVIR